jgi:hypothetical protein
MGAYLDLDKLDEGGRKGVFEKDQFLFQKFAEYQRFHNSFYDGKHNFSDTNYHHVFCFPGLGLIMASLNSCLKVNHKERSGWISNDQIRTAGSEMDAQDKSRSYVRIGVFHHHTQAHGAEDAEDMVQDFSKIQDTLLTAGFTVLMHGHRHESEAHLTMKLGGKALHVVATGSLLLKQEKTVVGNQYQVLELLPASGKARLYVRKYEPARSSKTGFGPGAWTQDLTISEADNGCIEFALA